jgi:DNA-binding response OmpR family regulator
MMPGIPQETLSELVALRQRVSDLEAEMAEFKSQQADELRNVHQTFGTSIGQTRMLVALAKGGIMSREQLMHFGVDNHEFGSYRLVDTMIKRIRRAVPWIKITTHYGLGYELTGESLAMVRAAMRGKAS